MLLVNKKANHLHSSRSVVAAAQSTLTNPMAQRISIKYRKEKEKKCGEKEKQIEKGDIFSIVRKRLIFGGVKTNKNNNEKLMFKCRSEIVSIIFCLFFFFRILQILNILIRSRISHFQREFLKECDFYFSCVKLLYQR